MKKGMLIITALSVVLLIGCAWQRIPDPPVYNAANPIPLNVGIVLGDTPTDGVFGPGVVAQLKEMGVFKTITYPYRAGDPVDGALKITVSGGWTAGGTGTAILIGLSLYTLSPFIGPNTTGIHDVNALLSKDTLEVVKYSIHLETSGSYGLYANQTEVVTKLNNLLTRKLAVEIANRINTDRLRILKEFGSNTQ